MALQRLNLSDAEYFALPYASNSGLKEAQKILKTGAIPTYNQASFRLGAAVDALLTAPDGFDMTGLDDDDRALIMPMRRALFRDPIYQALLHNADKQVVFVDTEFPVVVDGRDITVPAKCKFDAWNEKFGFGGDIKTTTARTQEQFLAAATHFGYDMQAAWYMDITGSDRFPIVGVSKINFNVFHYSIRRNDASYVAGKDKYLEYLRPWLMYFGVTGLAQQQ